MKRIVVASPLGGTGRTTLVAHMATLLANDGLPCLALDLCPQNQLTTYLGQADPVADGWANARQRGNWWGQAALQNPQGVGLLPYGQVAAVTAHSIGVAENTCWTSHEGIFDHQLTDLDLPQGVRLLVDTPVWPSPLAERAVACADVLIVTVDASQRAGQVQGLLAALLATAPAHAVRGVVLTGLDARRASHRQAWKTLRQQWGSLLLPYVVHWDEAIAEAHVLGLCVNTHAPHAQSAHDMQGIVSWLEGALREAATGGLSGAEMGQA